jgi:REP element-mobilizing transposase RayT
MRILIFHIWILKILQNFVYELLQIPQTNKSNIFLKWLKGWVSSEIINLCEQLAGQEAKVQRIPLFILKFVSNFLDFLNGVKILVID